MQIYKNRPKIQSSREQKAFLCRTIVRFSLSLWPYNTKDGEQNNYKTPVDCSIGNTAIGAYHNAGLDNQAIWRRCHSGRQPTLTTHRICRMCHHSHSALQMFVAAVRGCFCHKYAQCNACHNHTSTHRSHSRYLDGQRCNSYADILWIKDFESLNIPARIVYYMRYSIIADRFIVDHNSHNRRSTDGHR